MTLQPPGQHPGVNGDAARRFSFKRLYGLLMKEFIQMRRDRLTFAMMIGIPIMQLILFGYAINVNPKSLPTAIAATEQTVYTRAFEAALINTGYFEITARPHSAAEGAELIRRGDVQFFIRIPTDFSRKLERGERPQILVEADATDPSATGNAVAALAEMPRYAFMHDLKGPLASLNAGTSPFEVVVHRRYNPQIISQYNIVPGLIGVILTMTMVMFTALAMTRETERGTMEFLLAMPVKPFEVMIGKILPYVGVGYIQVTIILLAAWALFDVPMIGSLLLLGLLMAVFIWANLAVGFTFSTIARTQLQAVQMTMFFFLPSILLSGFMFPFRGMPEWAQWLGEILPLTHFLRIVRGILLKGNSFADIAPEAGALGLFIVAVSVLALLRYRQTLD